MACSCLSAPNHPRVVRQTIQCETGIFRHGCHAIGEAAHILLRDGGPRLSPGTRRSCTEYLGLPKVMPSLSFFPTRHDVDNIERAPCRSREPHTHTPWRVVHSSNRALSESTSHQGSTRHDALFSAVSRVSASIMTPYKHGPLQGEFDDTERMGGGLGPTTGIRGRRRPYEGSLAPSVPGRLRVLQTIACLGSYPTPPPPPSTAKPFRCASIVCLFGLARGGLAHVSVRSSYYGRNLGNDRLICWLTSCLFFQRGPAVWPRRPCDVMMVWAGVMANYKKKSNLWVGPGFQSTTR